jgi:hypothetical protein
LLQTNKEGAKLSQETESVQTLVDSWEYCFEIAFKSFFTQSALTCLADQKGVTGDDQ